ncbi:NAD(P)H-dependent flavin oxidoreductase [Sneathiella aquimaris]|uniref:NAD(P)H-dependent flavin oxidoreductase n=1 Tax=Sneathiella aquimaris TaxID=2599305 RepID=UPI00146D2AAD|nr:nitronate monooxygenase [Sneathiella aquimaris]
MNRFLEHTGAEYPIIQAPMGWIAGSQLASAVCNAGGLGIIETSSRETENCIAEIKKMKELTDRPFGINLPLLFLKDQNMINFVADSGVKFVTTSAGNPEKLIEILKAKDIIVYHAVPTVKAALKAVEAGVDGLVVEGGEGGGFKNPEEVSLQVLLQAIRDKVDVPMVAAGGTVDGRGMAAAFSLGAEAIQMGTRFVSATESPVHLNYKNAIIDAEDTGTLVLNKKATPCIRALKTELTKEIYEEGRMPADMFARIKELYFDGNMEASAGLSGQSAALIMGQKSAEDIINETISGFREICSRMGKMSEGGF